MRTPRTTASTYRAKLQLLAGLIALSPGWVFAQAGDSSKVAENRPSPTASPAAPATSPSAGTVQELQDEVKQLREELKAVKEATEANEATIKVVSDKADSAPAHTDLEALRDLEEENILRSIGSTTSISPYPVNGGYQHLVNLTGSSNLAYTSVPWGPSGTSTRSLRISSFSLALSGALRNDTGSEGDVRYNIGVLGSQNRYNATANTTQSVASSSASTINSSTLNGAYLNASDVWVALDVKTTKLELEPWWTLTLQLGQFLIPYGIEAVSTENNRPTVNQAQFVSKLGFNQRDLGLIATGGFVHRNDPSSTTIPLINYVFGIFDGAGPNTVDTNTGLDVLGRLVLNPFYLYAENFRNLSVGVNWYEGNLWSSTGALPTKRRLGGDLSWLRKPFLLTAEYVYSKDGYDGRRNAPKTGTGPSPTAAFAKGSTIVGTLFWTPSVLPDFQPWGRVDIFRPWAYSNLTDAQILTANNAGNWGNRRDAYSIGFNYFIWQVEPVTRRSYDLTQTSRVLKLQASYTRLRQETFSGAKNQIDVVIVGTL